MLGKVLKDRYEVLKPIGFGGMADVYLAKDRLLGRMVAVKVLKSEFLENPRQCRQFQREALAAAALQHPSIINIYDVADEDDIYYIVMEYVKGITLKKFVELKGKLPVSMAVDLTQQLAGALAEAHRHGIVHCDIKPQNILLDENGVPKIVDFGISKMVSGETKVYTSSLVGSVHYISPEQAKGVPVTAQSDIYSLGVVFYEMLTGRVPFDGNSPVVIAMKQLNEEPPRLSAFLEEVPDALQNVMDRALAKELSARYESAEALKRDLMLLLAGIRKAEGDGWRLDPTTPLNMVAAEVVKAQEEEAKRHGRAAEPEKFTETPLRGEDETDGGTTIVMRRPDDWQNSAQDDKTQSIEAPVLNRTSSEVMHLTPPEDEQQETPRRREKLEDFPEHNYPDGPRRADRDKKTQRQKEIHKLICIALITAIVVVLGIGSYFWYSAPSIEVPGVVGMSVVEAQKKLEEGGFRVRLEEVLADNVTPGTVVKQDPEGGTKRKEGSRITLSICKGLELQEVPGVVGLTYEQAKAKLEAAGYEIGSLSRAHVDGKPINTVIRQLPTEKSRLPQGSKIDLVINMEADKDADKVEMPELVGKKLSEAQDILMRLGLGISEIKEINNEKPHGEVLAVDPPAKTKADKETKIKISVSTGKLDGQVDGDKYVPGTGPLSRENGNTESAGTETKESQQKPSVSPKPVNGGKIVRYAEFTVPGTGEHNVRIIARDDRRSWTVFNGTRSGGSIVRQRVEGTGSLHVIYYVDGRAVGEAGL